MRPRSLRSVAVAVLLVAGLVLASAGCMGGGEKSGVTARRAATTLGTGQQRASAQAGNSVVGLDAEALSTFKSKDPFIQQALPPTTATTAPGPTPTTAPNTSTTFYLTTTTAHGATTTTTHGTTTTAAPTTTTTSPHRHTLKILSVGTVAGAAAVTISVDNSVYKDKRVGDAMSTSWGQVKILDINTISKVATVLHGSETLVLTVGQQIYE